MYFELMNGPDKGSVFALETGKNLIGRWDPDVASFPEVDLEGFDHDAKVSRKHATLEISDTSMVLTDLGSLNGTFLNRETRLEANKEYPVQEGDEVVIGKLILLLRSGDAPK